MAANAAFSSSMRARSSTIFCSRGGASPVFSTAGCSLRTSSSCRALVAGWCQVLSRSVLRTAVPTSAASIFGTSAATPATRPFSPVTCGNVTSLATLAVAGSGGKRGGGGSLTSGLAARMLMLLISGSFPCSATGFTASTWLRRMAFSVGILAVRAEPDMPSHGKPLPGSPNCRDSSSRCSTRLSSSDLPKLSCWRGASFLLAPDFLAMTGFLATGLAAVSRGNHQILDTGML